MLRPDLRSASWDIVEQGCIDRPHKFRCFPTLQHLLGFNFLFTSGVASPQTPRCLKSSLFVQALGTLSLGNSVHGRLYLVAWLFDWIMQTCKNIHNYERKSLAVS